MNINRNKFKKWLIRGLFIVIVLISLVVGLVFISTPLFPELALKPGELPSSLGEKIFSVFLGLPFLVIAFFSFKRLVPTIPNFEKIKKIEKEKWLKGIKWTMIILVIVTIGTVSFSRNYLQKVRLIVVNKNLPTAHILTKDDLNWIYLESNLVPDFAVTEKTEVIGQAILYPLSKDEIITTKYLNHKIDPQTLATLIPYNKFGFMLTSDFFSTPLPKIEVNDLVSILGASETNGRSNILFGKNKVYFVEYDDHQNPKSFLLALTPYEIELINKSRAFKVNLILLINPPEDKI